MFSRKMTAAFTLFAAVVAATLLLDGCASNCSGPEEEETEDDPYPLRTSPDNVLERLSLAYVDMDLEAYLDCLAEALTFHLSPDDYEEPGSELPEYWGKPDEQAIHEAMFGEATDVHRIVLMLANISKDFSQGQDPADPADDTWTHLEQVDLRVTVNHDNLTYLVHAEQDFVFQIDPDETGPDGETLWEIVEWWDLPEYGTRVENASWGGIKSMYR